VGRLREVAAARHQGRFDLLLALQVYFKAGVITSLAPARIKLGFDRARARDLNWLFTTHRIPPNPAGAAHTQDQYLEVPVVGLYGFTNPKRSGPYRLFTDLVVDGYARHPGEIYDVSTERRPGGMGRITAPMVLEKVDLALRRYGLRSPP